MNYNSAKLLIWARAQGVKFGRTATLGRQSFMGVSDHDLRDLFQKFGLLPPPALTTTGYIEPLLEELGAETVDSFDASNYEEATYLWDMNEAVSSEFHSKYDLVLDGGTFEHVFNFPTAISSAMKMVRKGGHLILCVPADGWFGHGFYQFSADLFYALFSPQNGYEMVKTLVFQDYEKAPIYEVASPEVIRKRNQLCSPMPALIYIVARRVGDIPASMNVMQSDYVATWNSNIAPTRVIKKRPFFESVFARRYIKSLATAALNFPFWDRRGFVRFDLTKKPNL